MNDLGHCKKCGSPILGNEWFCSNCGKRVTGRISNERSTRFSGRSAPAWVLVGVVVLSAVCAAVYFVNRRAARTTAAPSSRGALGRVARSMGKMEQEERRDVAFGCSLLSKEDAAAIAGTSVTRIESASDSCSYYGVPDPSLNPEAVSIKSMPGISTDPQVSKMIDQFSSAMRASVEAKEPEARAGPGRERLLLAVHDSAALSASMEAARRISDTSLGGERVPGIGEEAIFTTAHRMFFVRKGTNYILIQPQFVRDPRGVSIAAARKILESPKFGS